MAKCLKGLDVHLKVLSTKATHSRIPRAITDFPDRPKLKDDSIYSRWEHSDIKAKSTLCLKELLRILHSTHQKEGITLIKSREKGKEKKERQFHFEISVLVHRVTYKV